MTQPTPAGPQAPGAPLDEGVVAPPSAPPPEEDMRARRFQFSGSLRQRAARGTLINSAFLVGLSLFAFLRGFVLAGFLTRSDYGLFGVIGASLGTLVFLKQVGIDDKYVQQDEDDQEAAFQKAFTLELFYTGGLTLILVALVPVVAWAYHEPRLVLPGLVCVLTVPAAIFQTPLWVFYRRMEFGRQRLLSAVDPVVGTVVALVLAVAGAGYWALVLGLVAGAWASALAAVLFSRFKLRIRYERGTAWSYMSFSWPLFVANLSLVVMVQAATFSADAHLGLAAVGAITLATSIAVFSEKVDQIVNNSLYPAICSVKDKTALLFESFVKSNRLVLMWAVPFGAALTIFSPDLVTFGIGERWRPAVVVLQIYGIQAAINHIGFNWNAYFRARGETRPIAIAAIGATVAFLAVGIPLLLLFGLRGFAIGVGIQGFVHLAFRAHYLRRLFHGFGFMRHALRAFLPTIPAVAAVLLLRAVEPGERTLEIALGELFTYLAVTAAATWYFESRLLREAMGYMLPGRAAQAST